MKNGSNIYREVVIQTWQNVLNDREKQYAELPCLKQYCINNTIRTASRSCSQRDLRQFTIRLVRPILTRMDTDGHPEVDTEGQLWTQIDLNAHTPHAILSSALLTAC